MKESFKYSFLCLLMALFLISIRGKMNEIGEGFLLKIGNYLSILPIIFSLIGFVFLLCVGFYELYIYIKSNKK